MPDTILLTGATGHLGTALLPRLLAPLTTRVLALVRARDAGHLAERDHRLRRMLAEDGAADPGERLRVVAGDVSADGLGLSPADRITVLAEATSVVHSAASVRFDMPEDDAVTRNVQGTLNVLEFCDGLGLRLQRLDHVSTAYVAGDRSGRVLEDECQVGQAFRNSYEKSKCLAEEQVRTAMAAGLPACIHRPSIVVGDSRTGSTRAFNVLYWPLKLYARGWWRTVPGDPSALVDLVPVDFVADAIASLHRDEASIGACVHLAAGDDAITLGELARSLARIIRGRPIRFVEQGRYRRFVRPLLWPVFQTSRGKVVRRGGNAFMPYLVSNPLFDTSHAAELLGDLRPPPVSTYLERIVRYAMDRDFGG